MQQIMKRKGIIIGVVVAIVLYVLYALLFNSSEKREYEYDKISKGDVKKTISVTGVLQVIDPHQLSSKVNSFVKKVFIDYNQKTRKGQLLAIIDSTDIDQAIYKKGLQLESARLQLISAEKNLQGKRKMFKENLISTQGLKQAEIKYKKEIYTHKNVALDYKNLKSQKRNTRITSPISGTILSRQIDKDSPVKINSPLFIVVPSLKKMQLIINVDESDIGNIKKGQKVVFSVSAFPDKSFSGSIKQIRFNPVRKSGLVTYESLVICDNNELLLKPGMTATATVEIGEKKNVLRVLNQAFLVSPTRGEESISGEKYIWLKGSTIGAPLPVTKKPVKVGIVGDLYTELINSKLKEGSSVLINIREQEKK